MDIIGRIKNHFYLSVLRQRGGRRATGIINLDDARTIGIIYDSTPPGNDVTITKFAEMLRGKGKLVEIMAYIDDKKVDAKADISLFNPRVVNWYGVPIDERVTAFVNKPFDLLICALTNGSKPLEYIAYLSKAKYRIGPYDESKTDYYDLMIEVGTNKSLSYLLLQMQYFLEHIKYN